MMIQIYRCVDRAQRRLERLGLNVLISRTSRLRQSVLTGVPPCPLERTDVGRRALGIRRGRRQEPRNRPRHGLPLERVEGATGAQNRSPVEVQALQGQRVGAVGGRVRGRGG